jgi:hypothetical protein
VDATCLEQLLQRGAAESTCVSHGALCMDGDPRLTSLLAAMPRLPIVHRAAPKQTALTELTNRQLVGAQRAQGTAGPALVGKFSEYHVKRFCTRCDAGNSTASFESRRVVWRDCALAAVGVCHLSFSPTGRNLEILCKHTAQKYLVFQHVRLTLARWADRISNDELANSRRYSQKRSRAL